MGRQARYQALGELADNHRPTPAWLAQECPFPIAAFLTPELDIENLVEILSQPRS